MKAELSTKTKHRNHFIAGRYVSGSQGKTFDWNKPGDRKSFGQVVLGTADDIDKATQAAHEAFETGPWPRMSIKGARGHFVHKVPFLIMENKERLALAETMDNGKPISESRDGDIPRAAQNFQFFAGYAQSLAEDSYSTTDSERHIAMREPLGVAGLITPWNLPLYLQHGRSHRAW